MRRILAYVEGPTEEAFINRIVAPHLYGYDLVIIPTIATTKRVIGGPDFKGGFVPYTKAKKEIKRLLGDSDVVAVTSMLDYYALPKGFPGKEDMPAGDCFRKVEHLEDRLHEDISDGRFIPYFSLHEFEALVFTSPDEVGAAFPDEAIKGQIEDINSRVNSPEEIDDGKTTHPSARLMSLIPSYRKALHGPVITERIGLAAVRENCPHFAAWVTKLEQLSR